LSGHNHIDEGLLIARHLGGEATAAEEEALRKWMAMAPENEQTYLKYKRVYELTGKHYGLHGNEQLDIDVEKEWGRFVQEAEKREIIPIGPPPQAGRRAWLRIAAAILLAIVSGVVVNYFVSRQGTMSYTTAQNTDTVSLPDGSTVFLNRYSALTVKGSFGEKERRVELRGEAFFEVSPDKQKPFTVEAGGASITVLGTSFNVQSYAQKNELEVVVATGVVRLAPTGMGQSVELRAGDKGILKKNEKELTSNKNTDGNFLSWKTKHMAFDKAGLPSVLETLQATYGVEFVVLADVPAECAVTVTFDNQPLESVLKVLQATWGLTYRWEGNKIEITGIGC